MGKKIKIAFAGNYIYDCGSSNIVLQYIRTGASLGYDVRISDFSYTDDIVRATVPIAERHWQPDLFIINYETYPFLSGSDIDQICKKIPRSRRIVLDPDGKYSKPVFFNGDTNHPTANSYKEWTDLYNSLSDTVLQPILGESEIPNVKPFLYFGINSKYRAEADKLKEFDLIYIGSNWYRWQDICWLINTVAPIRSHIKRIALMGQSWDGDTIEGYPEASYSDPSFLRQNNVEVYGPVEYGQVEVNMSRGRLNPILVRPILNYLKLVTPRMFETFAANTVPFLPKYFTYASDLYGKEVKELVLSDNPQADIMRISDNYGKYQKLVAEIRNRLRFEHSYEKRLSQLLQFI